MAVITASTTGGNWNATTAWVGGVVPAAGDYVVINPSSGVITVNVSTNQLVGLEVNGSRLNWSTGTINTQSGINTTASVFFAAGASVSGTNRTIALNNGSNSIVTMTTNGHSFTLNQFPQTGSTVSLTDTLNLQSSPNITTRTPIVTGADMVILGGTLNSFIGTVVSPYKVFWRPTGVTPYTYTGAQWGQSHLVIDTTSQILLQSILTTPAGGTLEFASVPSSFTGSNTFNGRPVVNAATTFTNTSKLIGNAFTFSCVRLSFSTSATAPVRPVTLSNVCADEVVYVGGNMGNGTCSIICDDYFTASSINFYPTKSTTIFATSSAASLVLYGTGTYSIDNMTLAGSIYNSPISLIGNTESQTNVIINNPGAYQYVSNITNIHNYGAIQPALSDTLTNTKGFINTLNTSSTF